MTVVVAMMGLPRKGGLIIAYIMFYLDVTQHLLMDIAELLDIDLSRDRLTIEQRVQNEGLSFLTKSLPAFGKDLDSYLSTGKPPTWAGFSRTKDGYPKFLQALIRLVYPTVKSVQALRCARQLFYLFYKLEQPFDSHQISEFSQGFRETDESLPLSLEREDPVLDYATCLISHVLCRFEKDNILPRHGPGSVAEGIPHQKMENIHYYDQAESEFPFFEWCVPSLSAVCDKYHIYSSRETKAFGTSKVLFVPKDSRGPRVICCEPVTLQYLQQGIAREMVRCIEHSPLSRGRVNFTDQSINRRYAYYGSLGGGWATLDMKDASDRVSTALVKRLFSGSHVLPYLLATRSQEARLPDGTAVSLRKFAPMGSALCFPVEALVFWALAVSVLVNHVGYSRERAISLIKVYGDDIICSLEDYEAVLQYFPTVGLMFNHAKCCISGSFRESCGLDAFNGVDVTPIRIKTPMSSSDSIEVISSYCPYQRALWKGRYFRAAEQISRLLATSRLPVLCEEDDVAFPYLLGWLSNLDTFQTRYNRDLHRQEVYVKCPVSKFLIRKMDGYERLHWFFTNATIRAVKGSGTKRWIGTKEDAPASVDKILFPVRYRVTHKYRWCGKPQGA